MTLSPTASRGGSQTLAVISDSTLSGSAATFDIQNIAGSYTALKLILSARSDRAGATTDSVAIRFNNDSGTNYYNEIDIAAGDAVQVLTAEQLAFASGVVGIVPGALGTANYWGQLETTIAGYSATNKFKTYATLNGQSNGAATGSQTNRVSSGIWINTAAITRVTVILLTGPNFIAGSRCTLYGLAAS